MKFAVLDFATTGPSPQKDEIIQVGLVVKVDDLPYETYTSYVHPLRSISSAITLQTGISNEDVAEAPTEQEIVHALLPLLQDAILVGHHIRLDVAFLQAALDRSGYSPFVGALTDTEQLTRIVFPSQFSYCLSHLTEELGIIHLFPYKADSDAQATADLFFMCLHKLQRLPLETLERIVALCPPHADLSVLLTEFLEARRDQPSEVGTSFYPFRRFIFAVDDRMNHSEQDLKAVRGNQKEISYEQFLEIVQTNLEQKFSGFEKREGQTMMLNQVFAAFENEHHLVVEAGQAREKP